MAARVGIELSPLKCRIVEVAGASRRHASRETHVVSFASLARDAAATDEKLASLRGRRAAVVVWGTRSDHRQVTVASGSYNRMRAEARAAARDAGVETRGTLTDIAPLPSSAARPARRTVLVVAAAENEIDAALRPLVAAGVKIASVMTPAAALLSLARSRQSLTAPGALEAYVSIEETAGCVAFIRDGILFAARDLEWGYLDENDARAVKPRADIATRLAADVETFVAACGANTPLAQICVCGGLPELRSMTVPLMERLDVEVETLDSLFAIDAQRLPAPADEFRERAAELRLAWAAAADRRPPVNLLRDRQARATRALLSRAAIVGGTVAGLGVGWLIQDRLRPAETSRVTRAVTPPGQPVSPAPARRDQPPARGRTEPMTTPSTLPRVSPPAPAAAPAASPAARGVTPAPRVPLPVAAPPPARARTEPVPPPSTPPRVPAPPPTAPAASPAARGVTPVVPRVSPPAPPPVTAPSPAPPTPAQARPAAATAPPASPPPLSRAAGQGRGEEVATPFDAVLGTILYGPGRKLAIVDGRIVQPGDDVRGARIVDITPTAVLLRDQRGRLRRLSVSGDR